LGLRQFLQRTSILGRLHGSLCDAVLAASGSGAILHELDRRSLFVSVLDANGGWYRYHQLFAEVLRHNLRRDEPELEPLLHARATAWYVANGLAEEAVEQALAGGDWTRAAGLMSGQMLDLFHRGEEMTANRWLSALPDAVLYADSVLGVMRAIAVILLGDFAAAREVISAAEQAYSEAGRRDAVGATASLTAMLAAMRDDSDAALANAERALSVVVHSPPPFLLVAQTAMARALIIVGRCSAAGEVAARALPLINMTAFPTVGWQFHLLLARLRLMEGRLRSAEAQYATVSAMVAERPVFPRQAALIGLAVVAYEQNRLGDAADFLERFAEARAQTSRSTDLPFACLVRAWIARARGDPAAALDALQRCEAAAARISHTRLLRTASAVKAWLSLDARDLAAATTWADDIDRSRDDLGAYPRESELLVRARVAGAGAGRARRSTAVRCPRAREERRPEREPVESVTTPGNCAPSGRAPLRGGTHPQAYAGAWRTGGIRACFRRRRSSSSPAAAHVAQAGSTGGLRGAARRRDRWHADGDARAADGPRTRGARPAGRGLLQSGDCDAPGDKRGDGQDACPPPDWQIRRNDADGGTGTRAPAGPACLPTRELESVNLILRRS
jgi:ATP/maltotriose-dependent transcriptional regulator MalT